MASYNPEQYYPLIEKYAKQYGVNPDAAKAVMHVESSGNPEAQSPTGPIGLYQLSKATAQDAGINPDDRTDPETSIKAGIKTLAGHLKAANGDYATALGMYNQGRTGFNNQVKSGEYKPEVVNYINNPAFAPFVNKSKLQQIAMPVKTLAGKKIKNEFSTGALFKANAANEPSQADISASNAGVNTNKSVTDETPSNSLLQTQNQYLNAQNQKQLEADAIKASQKQDAYKQMAYMTLGAILGKNVKKQIQVTQEFKPGYVGNLQGFGNSKLNNFSVTGNGGKS